MASDSSVSTLFKIISRYRDERAAEQARQQDLIRLGNWLDKVRGDVEKVLTDPLYPLNAHCVMDHSICVDAGDFTKKELEQIAPRVHALHDLCMNHNVHLVVAGFDRLPRDGVHTETTWRRGPAVVVEVNTGKTYNHFSHPNFFQAIGKGGNTPPPSKNRPGYYGP